MWFRAGVVIAAVMMISAPPISAQSMPKGVLFFDSSKEKWIPVDSSGIEQQPIQGEPGLKGPYCFNIRVPVNYTGQAHRHPDTRTYTIVSGTWYVGFGDKFDESKLVALPAGSHYTEPGGMPHFVATKGEPAMAQVCGTGPSVTTFTGK